MLKIKKGKSSGIRNGKNSKGMNWWGIRRTEARIGRNGFRQGALGKNIGFNSCELGVSSLHQKVSPEFGSGIGSITYSTEMTKIPLTSPRNWQGNEAFVWRWGEENHL